MVERAGAVVVCGRRRRRHRCGLHIPAERDRGRISLDLRFSSPLSRDSSHCKRKRWIDDRWGCGARVLVEANALA